MEAKVNRDFNKGNVGYSAEECSIRITVLEARDLKAKNKNNMSDPVCFVKCGTQTQHTSIEKKTLSPYWDQTFFFTQKLSMFDFQNTKINFSVYNAGTFRRNELIGSYEIDLEWAYKEPEHEIWRKFIPLYNLEEGTEIQGYLRMNVVVLRPGDVPANHEDNEEDEVEDTTDLSKMLILPPDIEQTGYTLTVRCYKAEHLPKVDVGGKIDPLIQAHFNGEHIETKPMMSTFTPIWNEELRIPVFVPTLSDRIKVQLRDYEKIGKPRHLGTQHFSWAGILSDHYGPAWVNFYGAYNKINEDEYLISQYKGRALLTLLAEADPDPKLSVQPVSPCELPPCDHYVLWFDLYAASELPKAQGKAKVFLRIGPNQLPSKQLKPNCGSVEFTQRFEAYEYYWPKDKGQIPDFIIDVELGNSHVGSVRFTAEDAHGFDHKPTWHTIVPDIKDRLFQDGAIHGFLLFSLNYGLKSKAMTLNRPHFHKGVKLRHQIRAFLYMAKELPACDDSGTSSSYVSISLGDKKADTHIVPRTLYPMFFEVLRLNVEVPKDEAIAPHLAVQVWHKKAAPFSDVMLGRVEIPFSSIPEFMATEPEWLPLYVGDTSETEGALLCSFQKVSMNEAHDPKPSIVPATRPALVEFKLIGLRDLLSSSSVKSAVLEMDCGDGQVLKKTTPCVVPTPESPNILEVTHFRLNMPLNPLYSPTFNCRVVDEGRGGKLIGSASIPLAPYIPWINQEKPQFNLPEKAEVVPGADQEDDGEMTTFGAPELPEEKEARERREENERKRSEMDVFIPVDLLTTNARVAEVLDFTVDASEGVGGVRTLPDVDETKVGESGVAAGEDEAKSYPHELEFELKDPPFDEFHLWRGRKFKKNWLKSFLGIRQQRKDTRHTVGTIKANLTIYSLENAPESVSEAQRALLAEYKPRNYVVRVYMLRGRQIVPMDSNGKADPYLILSTGKTAEHTVNERENKQRKTLKPDFYKCYEIKSTIPGNSHLSIELWDWNRVSKDAMIGKTVIDLESRLMCPSWREMKTKPIEYRTLWSPESSFPQGKLEMWVEILTAEEARLKPPKLIQAPSIEDWELRVIIWNTKDVPFKDIKRKSPARKLAQMSDNVQDSADLARMEEEEKKRKNGFCRKYFSCKNDFHNQDKSDIFVSGRMELQKERQETDVHWRSTNGEGNFNWRMVFRVQLPIRVPRLKLQIWDKDILTPNDSIAEAVLNLNGVMKKAYKTKADQPIPRQWLTMRHPMFEGPQGVLELQLDLVNEKHFRAIPVGLGQDEPNQNPFLDPPNRPETSFPPWRVDKQAKFTYREYKTRMKCWCIIGIIAVAAVALIIVLFWLMFRIPMF
ncbi:putative Dysferlin protein [Blattamonas nauphoetae]|uniref:Dysferlin protein n=1 Tax=Blattamonas nauphoetae TaxID=2049346 RepID=A0ABQ9YJA2_9EUKA|nr:putative Dysferlin protein [Blattamonas nauphoetae]